MDHTDLKKGGRKERKEERKQWTGENKCTDELISHLFPEEGKDRVMFLKVSSENFVQGVSRGKRVEGRLGLGRQKQLNSRQR